MFSVLQNLIPVSPGVWLFFFILPGLLAFTGQLFLCHYANRKSLQLLPLYLSGLLILCVLLYRFTGFLAPVIGGFVALLLLGTSGFILLFSALGWVVYGIVRHLRRYA